MVCSVELHGVAAGLVLVLVEPATTKVHVLSMYYMLYSITH